MTQDEQPQAEAYQTKIDRAPAVNFVLMLSFIVTQVYMLGSTDPMLAWYSRKLICITFAMFSAISLELVCGGIWDNFFSLVLPDKYEFFHPFGELCITFTIFLLSISLTLRFQERHDWVYGLLQVLPHVWAFTIVGWLEHYQKELQIEVGCPLSMLIMALCTLIAGRLLINTGEYGTRRFIRSSDTANIGSEGHKTGVHLLEEIFEAQDEGHALVVSLILRNEIFYCLSGRVHGASLKRLQLFEEESDMPFLRKWEVVSCLFALLLSVLYFRRYQLLQRIQKRFQHRNLEFAHFLGLFLLAWSITESLWWESALVISKMHIINKMCVFNFRSGVASIAVSIVVVIIHKLADRWHSLQHVNEIVVQLGGVVMGFCWERSFGYAIHCISQSDKPQDQDGVVIAYSAAAVAFLLPGWLWYMVPQAMVPAPVPASTGLDTQILPRRYTRLTLIGNTAASIATSAVSSAVSMPEASACDKTSLSPTFDRKESDQQAAVEIEMQQNWSIKHW